MLARLALRRRESLRLVVALRLATALAARAAGTLAGRRPGSTAPSARVAIRRRQADKAGTTTLVVADKSNIHNFHLTGPGVNVPTSVPAVGVKTFTVTLKKGTYHFLCDPHRAHEGRVHGLGLGGKRDGPCACRA